jgi:LmbE family N-acetylglucosaminyl deacetylase
MRSLFLSPHADDDVLFGSFTILKHRPTVVTCFGSSGDYGTTTMREMESRMAWHVLGAQHDSFPLDLGLDAGLHLLDTIYKPDIVWAPAIGGSHSDHRDLSMAAHRIFKERTRHYCTYFLGEHGPEKERSLEPAPVDDPMWVQLKLRALACYESQIRHPRANQFFMWDLHEFSEQP